MKEAKAYRQGNFLIVEKCPFCGGIHTHTVHTTESDDSVDFGSRVPNCPNKENKGEEYRLVLEQEDKERGTRARD